MTETIRKLRAIGTSCAMLAGAYAPRAALCLTSAARAARDARKLRLFVVELAGVVLTSYGISLWSVPAAVIIGGLVLVSAVEVRPRVVPPMPALRLPDDLLRAQAARAAEVINSVRFGVPVVEDGAVQRLSRDDCERIIAVAKSLGAQAAKT